MKVDPLGNFSLIIVGLLWGITNPLIKKGTEAVSLSKKKRKALTGFNFLDSVLLHLTTPAFIIPQALNLCSSVLFALSLGFNDLSIAVPLANGTSLFANGILDHFLGNGAPLWPGFPGILLIITGVTLCSGASPA
ncbi:hypothetical protein Ndes2526B_g00297 [Nannochloris sp. 'desiccata']